MEAKGTKTVLTLETLSIFRNDPDNLARAEAVANSPHVREQYGMAAKYLKRFFAGKNGRDGMAVPDEELFKTEHLSTVLNTAMCPGVDMFYAILAVRGELAKGQDIKYLVSLLHECRSLKIPQNLIAGIACVHAELVGCWWNTLLPIDEIVESDGVDEEEIEPSDRDLDSVESGYAEVA